MKTIQEVMDMDVKELELSVRATNCMKRMNIGKLSELTSRSEAEILSMRNTGKKTLEEINGKMREIGLWYGMDNRAWLQWGLHHIEWIKTH